MLGFWCPLVVEPVTRSDYLLLLIFNLFQSRRLSLIPVWTQNINNTSEPSGSLSFGSVVI